VHLYQIWLLPDRKGLPPSYEELVPKDEEPGRLRLVASPDGASFRRSASTAGARSPMTFSWMGCR